ncbi:MAG TPA: ATP-binding protein [Candidatus Limnocylindria bacterium]
MSLMPRRLRGRLLIANLVVAAAAIGTVLVGVSLVGPGYFQEAMGHQPGDPAGQQMDELTLAAFHEAIRTALLAAAATALAAAVIVSLALSSRIANPVSRLVQAARRVAAGHYAERVPVEGEGEIGELAGAFNVMSASLEGTERRRVQLVGDVAHELRTPLTTLDGYLEGLQDGVIEPTAETWDLLRRETGRLMRLTGDLAELWRAEARQLPLGIEAVDVEPMLSDVLDRFAPMAMERRLRFETDIAPRTTVLADRDRLIQILGNFLSNAIRHAPSGSTIRVAVRREGADVQLSVADEGAGLSPEQQARVFERFYRLDAARSRDDGGAGIGLSIVRALAEAMDGHAWAESAGPGQGATFFVRLPSAART